MKYLKSIFILTFFFVVIFISQQNVFGCSCGGYPSVCDAYSSAEAVFVGTVTKVETVSNLRSEKVTSLKDGKEEILQISGWKHFIEVEKVYKGNLPKEVILATDNSTCSGKYEVGSKLLLYASFNKQIKMWGIPYCGRNTSFSDANDDLLFLNGLPKTANRTRISGELSQYEDTPENGFTRTELFAGKKVNIASKTKSYDITTDKNGVFEIYDLPLDIYTITPEIPKNLKIRFPIYYGFGGFLENILNESNSVSLDLRSNKCVGVDFLFNTNNKISGKVFDTKGKPMKDVCVDLIPLVQNKASNFRIFDCTEEDGSFILDDMPAGKYLILANHDGEISSSEPFSQLYFPNTFDKEKAAVIEIGEGEIRNNYDIHAPSESETIEITGKLTYVDGKPAADVFIEFKPDAEERGIEGKASTKTDSQGKFSLRVLKGLKGEIFGGLFTYVGEFENCPILDKLIKNKSAKFDYFDVTTPRIKILAESNINSIVLTLPFSACRKATDN